MGPSFPCPCATVPPLTLRPVGPVNHVRPASRAGWTILNHSSWCSEELGITVRGVGQDSQACLGPLLIFSGLGESLQLLRVDETFCIDDISLRTSRCRGLETLRKRSWKQVTRHSSTCLNTQCWLPTRASTTGRTWKPRLGWEQRRGRSTGARSRGMGLGVRVKDKGQRACKTMGWKSGVGRHRNPWD